MKYSPVLSLIKTTSDADHVSDQIDQLLSSLYRVKHGFEPTLRKSISVELANAIKAVLKSEKISTKAASQIKSLLENVQTSIQNLPVVNLTLAFSPSEEFIGKIQSHLGGGPILDIVKDPSILGGAVISANGKYKDHSVKKQLEKTFESKKKF